MGDDQKPTRWPVLPEWSRDLGEKLDAEWGLAARIARELDIDPSVLTDLKNGEYGVSEHVVEISRIAKIELPFANVSRPALRRLFERVENLSDEDLETLEVLAERLKKPPG
jgi:hypothetical protein